MILTATLNPVLDYFLEVDGIELDTPLRARRALWRAGGKGVNASRFIALLGGSTKAVVLAGGALGTEHARLCAGDGFECLSVPGVDSVRVNTVVSGADQRHVKANAPGPEARGDAVAMVAEAIAAEAASMRALVLGGSLPPGVPADALGRLAAPAAKRGVRVLVDAEGDALARALVQKPCVVKINAAELSGATGCDPEDEASVVRGAKALLARGVGAACITMGARGAVFATAEGAWRGASPAQAGRRPVGAGDAALGALALALDRGDAPMEALRLAIAAGTASAMHWPERMPTAQEVEALRVATRVEEVDG